MIGVISAPSPEKAAAKIFHQKFPGKKEATKEKPLEIRIRDLGAGSDYYFRIWIEISENQENEASDEADEKKAVKRLIIRKLN